MLRLVLATGLTMMLYGTGNELHPAAEAVMEKETPAVVLFPLLLKVLCTGLSDWFDREAGAIPGSPVALHVNAGVATCDERAKLVAPPEQMAGWEAGVIIRSGIGLIFSS